MSLTEESKVCIKDEIDDLIGCINIETFAEPINCHLRRCHGIEHEILQILQGLWIGEKCFVHVSTIHDLGRCAYFVCHLADRTRAAAVLNKKCILRIGTVSVNEGVAFSLPQVYYDPPSRCERGSKDTVAYM